ncbi:hypothetical protein [Paracoccus pacificus]|uniref:Lytic murein transglycosylase n=1 Tax=Paracoccus pacificus TaxID=1463598 RepID=A0ABW4RDD6_9RHOB
MMRVAALLALWGSALPALAEPASLQAFREEVAAQLLAGPIGAAEVAEYRARLADFTPEDRLRAIIFLRRSGIMEGAPLSLTALLKPARDTGDRK